MYFLRLDILVHDKTKVFVVVIPKPDVPTTAKVELLSEVLPKVVMVFVIVVARPLDHAIAVA